MVWIVLLLSPPVQAEERPDLFPLAQGLKIKMKVQQPLFQFGIFTTEIEIVQVRQGEVVFDWQMREYQSGKFNEIQGRLTVTGLDDGDTYNPYFSEKTHGQVHETKLWLSKKAFRELKKTGKTLFRIDTEVRSDPLINLEFLDRTTYRTLVNGEMKVLSALKVKSDQGDEIIVMDSEENPFILFIYSQSRWEWHVAEVTYAPEFHPVEPKPFIPLQLLLPEWSVLGSHLGR
jgi:hypothetical protein